MFENLSFNEFHKTLYAIKSSKNIPYVPHGSQKLFQFFNGSITKNQDDDGQKLEPATLMQYDIPFAWSSVGPTHCCGLRAFKRYRGQMFLSLLVTI